ncbi:YhfC family intramembrane metalloprotease [Bacillus sp. sid0103]|uniref:YhfC family intramembrane metalloprotease n=1 Tax=Bacillus sp. sid0103 TaxID=2856337 RepID=UPI001C45599A|nr:YhfC family glutamic-type intramembrane protease [Bacillus sp. sid0103]MBV7505070.1 YhfC family intramembrane metalloprotease [Bacillus sp. sid0103]
MVSTATIISMFVPIVVSFVLFAGLILVYRKKTGIAVKPVVIGAIGFVVTTQVLEKALHVVVVTNFPNYADHPWLFGLYGGMAAGLFEELGRFLLFTWLLKKFHDYKGGISFGIGWGGIEAVVLVLMTVVPNIIFAFMINSGTFESSLAAKLPADQLSAMKDSLLNQGVSFYLLGCLERLFAVFMQIAFSLFVLIGVVKKKFSYVIYVILIHAAIDFPLVFFQTGHLKNLLVIELYVAIVGLLSFVFIKKARNMLPNATR